MRLLHWTMIIFFAILFVWLWVPLLILMLVFSPQEPYYNYEWTD
ncbi:MAG: hypothetical protein AAF717_00200 [Bacteroidota bacterium]